MPQQIFVATLARAELRHRWLEQHQRCSPVMTASLFGEVKDWGYQIEARSNAMKEDECIGCHDAMMLLLAHDDDDHNQSRAITQGMHTCVWLDGTHVQASRRTGEVHCRSSPVFRGVFACWPVMVCMCGAIEWRLCAKRGYQPGLSRYRGG
jgi:hypothetical protein